MKSWSGTLCNKFLNSPSSCGRAELCRTEICVVVSGFFQFVSLFLSVSFGVHTFDVHTFDVFSNGFNKLKSRQFFVRYIKRKEKGLWTSNSIPIVVLRRLIFVQLHFTLVAFFSGRYSFTCGASHIPPTVSQFCTTVD